MQRIVMDILPAPVANMLCHKPIVDQHTHPVDPADDGVNNGLKPWRAGEWNDGLKTWRS